VRPRPLLPFLLALSLALPAVASGQSEVVVFVAASLREAFGRIAERFEKDHPGVRVVLNLAGSQELAAQIEHGAGADVFASADRVQMERLERSGLVSRPLVFAANEPVLVVAPGGSAKISALGDLPRAERIVLGAPEVPIGRYSRQILDRAANLYGADFRKRVEERVVSNELNVRQVLAKVALGEADAGIVYRTDVVASRDRVEVVRIPDAINVTAEYPIAALAKAPHPELARAWIDAVGAAAAKTILAELGFASGGAVASGQR
jgi:molybdate transport system substrate-binding protein